MNSGDYLVVSLLERQVSSVRCNRKEVADSLARWLQNQDQAIKVIVIRDPVDEIVQR